MRNFANITEMVKIFKESEKYKNINISALSDIDFMALIYSLDNGNFESTGVSSENFCRYFLTSGKTELNNLPLDIINNLPYSKIDFKNLV